MSQEDDARLVAQMAAAIYAQPEWSGMDAAVTAAVEILAEARKQVAAMAPSEGDGRFEQVSGPADGAPNA